MSKNYEDVRVWRCEKCEMPCYWPVNLATIECACGVGAGKWFSSFVREEDCEAGARDRRIPRDAQPFPNPTESEHKTLVAVIEYGGRACIYDATSPATFENAFEDMREAAANARLIGPDGESWTFTLREMSTERFKELPDFEGW